MQLNCSRIVARAMMASILLLAASSRQPLIAQTVPTIAFITPSSAPAGSPTLTISVIGSNFVAGAVVNWNAVQLQTTFQAVNQLTAVVPTTLLASQGVASVTVVVPSGAQASPVSFTISARAVSITTATLAAGAVGVAYSGFLAASDGTPPYTWTATGLPPGISLTPGGFLTGTPTTRGDYSVSFVVTDQQQRTASRIIPLTVSPPPLSINTDSLPTTRVGTAFSVNLTAVNGTAPYRWTLDPLSPAWLTLNPTTGVLSGTPPVRGSFPVSVTLSDNARETVTKRFTLLVQPPPLTITTVTPLFSGVVGSPYSQTFVASGGTPPYQWSTTAQIPGLLLDPANGVLTGTPTVAGTYSFPVQVSDSESVRTSQTFSLIVEQPRITIAVNAVLPAGVAGVPYQFRMIATGGTAPYTWSLISGSVPGLSLGASTGILGDTPTTAGTFSFVVQATDAVGLTVSRPFVITIAAGPPKITPAPQGFTAIVGSQFEASFEATGGVPPYTWVANGLPEGLSIDSTNGRISGIPAAAGPFLFTIRVTDSANASDTELFQVAVSFPQLPAIRTLRLPDVAPPASQMPVEIQLDSPYALPISGQLILAFAPQSGAGDAAVQFATGGRSLDFTIPAGETTARFTASPAALQTGTVAGSLILSARVFSLGRDVVSSPVPVHSMRIERAAPVIVSARYARTSAGLDVQVTGYSTAKEVTQVVFRFSSTGGTLRNPEVTISNEDIFARWFGDSNAAEFGSQFTYIQSFASGANSDLRLVTPVSVTLTNRIGSTTAQITQ